MRYQTNEPVGTEVTAVADILLRGLPDDVVEGLDRRAARLGVSRAELIRRELTAVVAADGTEVAVADLIRCSAALADLADPEVMAAAWS